MKSASIAGVLLSLLPTASALAAPDVWVQSGPPGGHVTALAVSPDVPGLSYAALEGGGLWKSTDGGETYLATTDPAPGITIGAIAFDRSDPSRVYVGAGNVLHVTSDDGGSFTEVAEVFDAITVILPDPSLDDRLYVATENGGVFKSDDHGATFADLESLSPFDPIVHAMAIDPTDSDRIYIGTSFSLFWSDDAGETVTASDTGPAEASAILVDPTDPTRIYVAGSTDFVGGVVASSDSGLTWGAPTITDIWPTALALDASDSSRLYLGTMGSGIWRSDDAAATWVQANVGLAESKVSKLVTTTDGELLLGGSFGGIYSSADAASSWQRGGAGFSASWIDAIATSPSRILATAKGNGVFASSDSGATWSFAGDGLPIQDVISIAIDPSDEDVIYAGTDGAGVFKSSNGLASWSAAGIGLTSESVTAIAADPSDASFVLAGLRTPVGPTSVFLSHDGGATFTPTNDAIPGWVTAIVFSAGDVYVATEGEGLWKSGDKGQTFLAKNNGAGDYGIFLLSFAAHPVTGFLYEGQHGGGLGVSLDEAEQWSVMKAGLPGFWLAGVAPHPSHAGELFVGTYFDGVVRSPDDGLSFQAYSAGLTNKNLSALAMTPDAGTLIAGTRGGGTFIVEPTPLPTEGEGGGGAGAGGEGQGGEGPGGSNEGGAPTGPSSGGNGGEPLGGGDATEPKDDGCSCDVGSSSSAGGSFGVGLLLAAVLATRTRARARHTRR